MPGTQSYQASDDGMCWKFQQTMGREPSGHQKAWERTAAGWAEAGGSHTGRQGGEVERVWALERQTSWNSGSMFWLCSRGYSRCLSQE